MKFNIIYKHKYVNTHEINGTVMLSVPFIETASIIVIIIAITMYSILRIFFNFCAKIIKKSHLIK